MSRTSGALTSRRTGAIERGDGTVLWRVWAPLAREVTLVIHDGERKSEVAMAREERGFHFHVAPEGREGQRYAFRLDGGPERPDPCSLWQPDTVDGPSAVVFPSRFPWSDKAWKGVAQPDLVFYEIHVGTFTREGTFEAIIGRLEDLKELGITAIEIMPVGQFPGTRNWGYDGVLLYATQNSYGGPHGFQKLLDACHAHGMAIFLDAIYNHVGPEANFLGEFGPYFTDHYKTPWGPAVNYDRGGCDAVRDFVLDNVRMWLEEFHVDGLRLDAADCILDLGAHHILRAIKETADTAGERRGWPAIITAETDLNDPRLLYPPERGGHALNAQWMDDYHHAAHAFFTGQRQSYYRDFGEASQLRRILEEPYLYAGEYSAFRDRKHGARAEGLSGDRFVVFLQNHDQIGNSASGDRLGRLMMSTAKQRLAASYLLLSPYLPLLFMGEEYGEDAPFPFFCSFQGEDLVKVVREGRRAEYSARDGQTVVPDPEIEETFASARLSWSWPEGTPRAGLRRLHRDLLTARREWPVLRDFVNRSASLSAGQEDGRDVLELKRGSDPANGLRAYYNLSGEPRPLQIDEVSGSGVLFSSESLTYGGSRDQLDTVSELLPYECVALGPTLWRRFS